MTSPRTSQCPGAPLPLQHVVKTEPLTTLRRPAAPGVSADSGIESWLVLFGAAELATAFRKEGFESAGVTLQALCLPVTSTRTVTQRRVPQTGLLS